MLEKAAAIKRFEYTQFGSQLKKQPDIAKKKKKKNNIKDKTRFYEFNKKNCSKNLASKSKNKTQQT